MSKDLRKKTEVKIKVTHKDLLGLENLLRCIPLCDKHKTYSPKEENQIELESMHLICKGCEKVYRSWWLGAERIESALWEAFGKKMKWQ